MSPLAPRLAGPPNVCAGMPGRRRRRFLNKRYSLGFPGVMDSGHLEEIPDQAVHYPPLLPFPLIGPFPALTRKFAESLVPILIHIDGEVVTAAAEQISSLCSGRPLIPPSTSSCLCAPGGSWRTRARRNATTRAWSLLPRKWRGSRLQSAQSTLPPIPVPRREAAMPAAATSVKFEGEAPRLGRQAVATTLPRIGSLLGRAAMIVTAPASPRSQFVGPCRGLGRWVPLALPFFVSSLRKTPCTVSHHRRLRQMKTVKCTQRVEELAAAVAWPPMGRPPWRTRSLGRGSRGSEAGWRRTRGPTRQLLARGTTAAVEEAPVTQNR